MKTTNIKYKTKPSETKSWFTSSFTSLATKWIGPYLQLLGPVLMLTLNNYFTHITATVLKSLPGDFLETHCNLCLAKKLQLNKFFFI